MTSNVATKPKFTHGSGYTNDPDYKLSFEPSPRRVRCVVDGETLADSTAMRLLHEPGHIPVYYFPRDDVKFEFLRRTDHSTHCPWKGEASYWSIRVGDRVIENAAWSYQDPYPEIAGIKDYVAFYWSRVDHWYEEDEEVFVHARDPYKRIDVVDAKRPVKVILGGVTIAETRAARFVFETGMPTRYYIPERDVRTELLQQSSTRTACPYKGTASYYTARIEGTEYADIVWYYPDPIAEMPRIKGYLSFFNENVDEIQVDGQVVPKVETRWTNK